jgi:hypothetical protein
MLEHNMNYCVFSQSSGILSFKEHDIPEIAPSSSEEKETSVRPSGKSQAQSLTIHVRIYAAI